MIHKGEQVHIPRSVIDFIMTQLILFIQNHKLTVTKCKNCAGNVKNSAHKGVLLCNLNLRNYLEMGKKICFDEAPKVEMASE